MGKVSAFLKIKRKEKGMRITEVWDSLIERGHKISPVTLYGYENGVSEPRIEIFLALCDIYEVEHIRDELKRL